MGAPQSRPFGLTSGHSRTFPGAGCCAHRVTLPPSGFGKMLPIFNSPTSQVNKLETDRMSIIRRKIKGRGMKHIPSRVSEENAVSLAASKTLGTVRPWVWAQPQRCSVLDNLSPRTQHCLSVCMYVYIYTHTYILFSKNLSFLVFTFFFFFFAREPVGGIAEFFKQM